MGKFLLIMGVTLLLISLVSGYSPSEKIAISVSQELTTQEVTTVYVITSGDDESTLVNIQDDATITQQYTTFNGFEATINSNALEKLDEDPNVLVVGEVRNLEILLQDSVPLINATVAHITQVGGTNITGLGETVCVIDTGIDYNHAELSASVISGAGYDYYNNDDDPIDDNDHGTHVAGIVHRVAPDALLIAMKVCDGNGQNCASTDIAAAIDYCVANKTAYNISIITISLGDGGQHIDDDCYPTDIISIAAESAESAGIFISVSSGNDAYTSGINYPGCLGNVTSVGGTTKADTLYANGNTGSNLDLLAPAVIINSTIRSGAYSSKTGTSMAAPHVAGAASLLFQYGKLSGSPLTPAQVEAKLQNSGVAVSSWKRIDVFSALTASSVAAVVEEVGGGGSSGGGGGGGSPSGSTTFTRIVPSVNSQWALGQIIPIKVKTYDGSGRFIDISMVTMTIKDSQNNQVYYTIQFTKEEQGIYVHNFPVPNEWVLGEYTIKITATTGAGLTGYWAEQFGISEEKKIEVVLLPSSVSITNDGTTQNSIPSATSNSNIKKAIIFFSIAVVFLAAIIGLVVYKPKRRVKHGGRRKKRS